MAHVYHQTHYVSPCVWMNSAHGDIPPNNPVVGGRDLNGESIYVGRALHETDCIPGKVVSSHRVCYVPWGGAENAHHSYQVLTNPNNSELVWVQACNGEIPTGALVGGKQADGLPLYIGRAYYQNSIVVGKVHTLDRVLYIPFDKMEIPIGDYEILTVRNIDTTHGY